MKKLSICLILVIILITFTNCGHNVPKEQTVTIQIAAAASLTDALNDISIEYQKESSDELLFNFAGSGSLKMQIQEGAPCDIFISASKEHMDELETQGMIDIDSRTNLLENTLTLIASKEKKGSVSIDSLASDKVKSISIGTPESVPAGNYAHQSLESLGLIDKVQSKLILGKDVRSVLDYVETGNVDCGFVYKTDAILLESGTAVEDIPEELHDPIVYPMAVIKNSKNKEEVIKFYTFLQGDYAKEVFEKYGFTVL